MNRFTIALISASLTAPMIVATPAMAQAKRHDDHRGAAAAKPVTYKTFRKGERFDRSRARNYQQIDYRKYRNVKAPPKGYQYVRSGNDLLLVSISSGIIAAATAGMFR